MPKRHIVHIRVLILLVLVFIIGGIFGYMALESLTFTDALLRTLLTFSTLGYGEVTTQSFVGKWFTIGLIVVGVAVIVYATSGFVRAVIEGEVSGYWRGMMQKHKLSKLRDHAIVVGFGRVGRQVAEELMAEGQATVVIDKADKSAECEALGLEFVQGDVCISDEPFVSAGLNFAKVVIIAIGTDSESLSASVTARALNQDIFIVSRATSKQAESRLLRIGVNRVALPAYIGGYHMATMAMRPSVVDFLDLLTDGKRDELQIEELFIENDNTFVGQKVFDHFGSHRGTVALLAMRRKGQRGFLRPTGTTQIELGDQLILMGTTHQLDRLLRRK